MATRVISAAALVGDRAGHGRQPLVGVLQSTPHASTALQMAVPAGDASAHRRRPCRLLPPLAGIAGLPCGLALAAIGHHLAGGLSHGLAMDGWPWRSYIPIFSIRMEKMKEVKRPPLYRYPHDRSLQ
ncbi:hypothetical protein BHM03_00030512 [Ensete ventricosum]|nr:hypothetical protein BHM03_00030512 [Ensete ventricosum]